MKGVVIALAFVAAIGSAYIAGVRVTSAKNALRESEQTRAALQQLADATERMHALELAAQRAIDSRTAQFKKDIQHAKDDRDRFIAGVRSGAIRLSIPVAACHPDTASAHPAPAAGSGHPARAELDPAAAATLEAIAGDGDDGIRQLNACIASYNLIREKYHVQNK